MPSPRRDRSLERARTIRIGWVLLAPLVLAYPGPAAADPCRERPRSLAPSQSLLVCGDRFEGPAGEALILDVTANDREIEGRLFTIRSATATPSGASVTVQADGSLRFVAPAPGSYAVLYTIETEDGRSASASATVEATEPRGLSLTLGLYEPTGDITLSWTDPDPPASPSYDIEHWLDGGPVEMLATGVEGTSFLHSGPPEGENCYRVRRDDGSAQSAVECRVSVLVSPTATAITLDLEDRADWIRLLWDSELPATTTYRIFAGSPGGALYERATVVGATSFDDTLVPAGETRCYQVSAIAHFAVSPIVCATRPRVVLSVNPALLASRIDLSWVLTGLGVDGFEVLRDGAVATTPPLGAATRAWTDPSPGTPPHTYSVRARRGGPGWDVESNSVRAQVGNTVPSLNPHAPLEFEAVGDKPVHLHFPTRIEPLLVNYPLSERVCIASVAPSSTIALSTETTGDDDNVWTYGESGLPCGGPAFIAYRAPNQQGVDRVAFEFVDELGQRGAGEILFVIGSLTPPTAKPRQCNAATPGPGCDLAPQSQNAHLHWSSQWCSYVPASPLPFWRCRFDHSLSSSGSGFEYEWTFSHDVAGNRNIVVSTTDLQERIEWDFPAAELAAGPAPYVARASLRVIDQLARPSDPPSARTSLYLALGYGEGEEIVRVEFDDVWRAEGQLYCFAGRRCRLVGEEPEPGSDDPTAPAVSVPTIGTPFRVSWLVYNAEIGAHPDSDCPSGWCELGRIPAPEPQNFEFTAPVDSGDYYVFVRAAPEDRADEPGVLGAFSASDWQRLERIEDRPPSPAVASVQCVEEPVLGCAFVAADSDDFPAEASYRWEFGDGSPVAHGQTANHAYATPGSYIVTLTVTDGAGQEASITQTVDVARANRPPIAHFVAECSATRCVLDARSSADDGPSGTLRYHWWVDPGFFVTSHRGATATSVEAGGVTAGVFESDEAVVVVDPIVSGLNTIRLEVTDAAGAVDSIERSIATEPGDPGLSQGLALWALLEADCTPTSSLTDCSLRAGTGPEAPGGPAPSLYEFQIGDGAPVVQATPSFTALLGSSGIVRASVRVIADNGTVASHARYLLLDPEAAAAMEPRPEVRCQGARCTFEAWRSRSATGLQRFTWRIARAGEPVAELEGERPAEMTLASGPYEATLEVEDWGGKSASATVTFAVDLEPIARPDEAIVETLSGADVVEVDLLVLRNDEDPEGEPLRLVDALGARGSVEVVATRAGEPALRYRPEPGFEGLDTFFYIVSDGTTSAAARVRVDVRPMGATP